MKSSNPFGATTTRTLRLECFKEAVKIHSATTSDRAGGFKGKLVMETAKEIYAWICEQPKDEDEA